MSRRVRRRYLALRVVSEQPFNGGDVMDVVWRAVVQLFGEYGASKVGLSLIECDLRRNYVILRCSHVAVDVVRASVVSVTEMSGKPVVMHVLGVSGTLRALRRKA